MGLKVIPKWFTEGCSYIGTYRLQVKRSDWRTLDSSSGGCKGYNQPYLCGWGGLTTGPSSVPRPLVAFDTGGGVTSDPTCIKHSDPKGGRNTWPHNLFDDEGYFDVGAGETVPPPGGGGGVEDNGGEDNGGNTGNDGNTGGGADSGIGANGKCSSTCIDRCYSHILGG